MPVAATATPAAASAEACSERVGHGSAASAELTRAGSAGEQLGEQLPSSRRVRPGSSPTTTCSSSACAPPPTAPRPSSVGVPTPGGEVAVGRARPPRARVSGVKPACARRSDALRGRTGCTSDARRLDAAAGSVPPSTRMRASAQDPRSESSRIAACDALAAPPVVAGADVDSEPARAPERCSMVVPALGAGGRDAWCRGRGRRGRRPPGSDATASTVAFTPRSGLQARVRSAPATHAPRTAIRPLRAVFSGTARSGGLEHERSRSSRLRLLLDQPARRGRAELLVAGDQHASRRRWSARAAIGVQGHRPRRPSCRSSQDHAARRRR